MRIGVDARILVPGYPAVLEKMADLQHVRTLADPWTTGGTRLMKGDARRRALLRHRCAGDVRQAGQPLSGTGRQVWPDNHFRFALLSWVAAWFAGGDGGWRWRAGRGPWP